MTKQVTGSGKKETPINAVFKEEVALKEAALEEVVSAPLRCVFCEYNLLGQSLAGDCPECGTSVLRSSEQRKIVDLSFPPTRQRVVAGFEWMLLSLVFYWVWLTNVLGLWTYSEFGDGLVIHVISFSLFPVSIFFWLLANKRLLDAIGTSAPSAIKSRVQLLRRLLMLELVLSVWLWLPDYVVIWIIAPTQWPPNEIFDIVFLVSNLAVNMVSGLVLINLVVVGAMVYKNMRWRVFSLGSLIPPLAVMALLDLSGVFSNGILYMRSIRLADYSYFLSDFFYDFWQSLSVLVMVWFSVLVLVLWFRLKFLFERPPHAD